MRRLTRASGKYAVERGVQVDADSLRCVKGVEVEDIVATLEAVEQAMRRAPAGAGTANE